MQINIVIQGNREDIEMYFKSKIHLKSFHHKCEKILSYRMKKQVMLVSKSHDGGTAILFPEDVKYVLGFMCIDFKPVKRKTKRK